KEGELFVANSQQHYSFIASFSCCRICSDMLKEAMIMKNSSGLITFLDIDKEEKGTKSGSMLLPRSENEIDRSWYNKWNSQMWNISKINNVIERLQQDVKACNSINRKQKKGKRDKYSPLPLVRMFSMQNRTSKNGLIHPYDLAWYPSKQQMFVSVQDTHSIFVYDEHGMPIHVKKKGNIKYPGEIIRYERGVQGDDTTVRGIAVDDDIHRLFVTVPFRHMVMVYCTRSEKNNAQPCGLYENIYNISWDLDNAFPIDVVTGSPYYNQTIFVGDKFHNRIYAYHVESFAVSKDALYVVSKQRNRVLLFDPQNGHYQGELLHFDLHVEEAVALFVKFFLVNILGNFRIFLQTYYYLCRRHTLLLSLRDPLTFLNQNTHVSLRIQSNVSSFFCM
ncbi:hypothetical protein RFI_21390, partial [Reticulomyxa filosa]